MTTTYALDTDVISIMARAASLREWKAVGLLPVAVTEVVYAELSDGNGEKAETAKRVVAAVAPAPVAFEAGSDLAGKFAEVLEAWPPPPKKTDVGERSVVALSLLRDDHVAVMLDFKALYLAAEELRGRVLSMHGFLHALTSMGKLDSAMAKRVSDRLVHEQRGRRKPTWWPHG